jgi:hypothetical protein
VLHLFINIFYPHIKSYTLLKICGVNQDLYGQHANSSPIQNALLNTSRDLFSLRIPNEQKDFIIDDSLGQK